MVTHLDAEDINLFTRTSFSSSDLGIWNSVLGVRQLYYLMVEFQANIERVHVVRNDGIFVSVAADRQPQLDIGSSHSPAFQVSYLNRTTRPYALTYAVDGGCSLNDTTCVFQAFLPESVPLARTTVDIRASPFFQQALQRQQSGWTSVYLSTQATNITRPKLMVTAIQPVWIRNTFLFVGAVEISLDSLSNYLSRLASLVSASGAVSAKDASVDDAATRPLMLVLEARTGLMVASSSTDQVAVTSPTGNRLSIVESSSVQVKRFLESIRLEFGGLDQIPWSSMENPIIVDDGASLAVASPYTRSGGDIDWYAHA